MIAAAAHPSRRLWRASGPRSLLVVLCMLIGVTLITPARPAAAQTAPVLTVYIIEASNGPGGVDPAVREIYNRMGPAFGYSTFRLISTVKNTIPIGGEKVVLAPGSRQLFLRPKSVSGDRLSVDVEIRKRDSRPMRVSGRLVRGGTFVVGGYPHGDGRLVFAISAQF